VAIFRCPRTAFHVAAPPYLLVNPERLPLALGAGQFVEAIAEVEPYPLAEEHKGRCAVKVTLYTAEGSGRRKAVHI